MRQENNAEAIWVRPTGGACGADVHGVDLAAPMDEAAFKVIADAWSAHLVLRFSGQRLDDDGLIAFSRRFGELDRVPIGTGDLERKDNGVAEHARPWVVVISNVKVGGKAIGGLGSYELAWHTDMSYNPIPPRASLLYALECPAMGGDTGFTNMYRAYETLPEDLKRRIQGLDCIHDASLNSAGERRLGFQAITDVRQTPGAVHPIVRLHPVTRRQCLFLGRRANAYIPGLSLADSEALLDRLWAHAAKPEFAWYQRWRVGDLMLWDNRCAMHRRDSLDETGRRLMHRTQIVGEAVEAA
ncbi:MAG: TauD/TfdA family dioxygenase [Alphaproteobacteria bacterium]|nr:TauD/TfdA family dioxygenase [Alphaproteobacteria bacterium]